MQSNLPFDLLVCPQDHTPLHLAETALIESLNQSIARGELKNTAGQPVTRPLDGGLLRADGRVLYPIVDEIPIFLPDEAIGVVPP
jgi:uncharacterized protein YbaR (Trm112 family)